VGMTLDIVLCKHDLIERRLHQFMSSKSPNEAKMFIEDGGSMFSKTLEKNLLSHTSNKAEDLNLCNTREI